jgi:hypothetical protein
MTPLTRISITVRKIIRWGIFFAIFLIIARITFGIGYGIFRYFFPKPPPPPTVTWGKLPALPFPDKTKINLTFSLETPEGGLPKLPTQEKVYFMPKAAADLLSLDITKTQASGLGFNPDNPTQISQTTYSFPHKNIPSTFEVNIVTGTFSISYNLGADPTPLSRKPPTPEVAASYVRSYLSSGNLLPGDLTGDTASQFLKPEGGRLVPALSLSDSNVVKISLFRKKYDDLPSLTPDPGLGNVWFLVSGQGDKGRQVFAGEYHYFKVDESQSSTYPIKTPEKVWEEFNSGGFFLANLGTNKSGDSVKIRRVYLAYYDAGIPTQFFQPIYVFEGDGNFMAYLPAVTSDYYGQ